MAVPVYMAPEELWGYDLVTSAYKETPKFFEISALQFYFHSHKHPSEPYRYDYANLTVFLTLV